MPRNLVSEERVDSEKLYFKRGKMGYYLDSGSLFEAYEAKESYLILKTCFATSQLLHVYAFNYST